MTTPRETSPKAIAERVAETIEKNNIDWVEEITAALESYGRECREQALDDVLNLPRPYTIEAYKQHIRALK